MWKPVRRTGLVLVLVLLFAAPATSGDRRYPRARGVPLLRHQVESLNQRVSDLEEEIAALRELLGTLSIEDAGRTLRLTGVNLQIVDGTGDTDGPPNGLGNLIVGYNERFVLDQETTGSHNLVVGRGHTYTSTGGIVAGQTNAIRGSVQRGHRPLLLGERRS